MLQNKQALENEFDDELTELWKFLRLAQVQTDMTEVIREENIAIWERIDKIQRIEASMGNHLSKAQIEQKQQSIKSLDNEICALMNEMYLKLDPLDKELEIKVQNVTSTKALNKLIAQYRKEALQAIQEVK